MFLYTSIKPVTNILCYTPIVFRIVDIIFYNHYYLIPPKCNKIIYGNEISYLDKTFQENNNKLTVKSDKN